MKEQLRAAVIGCGSGGKGQAGAHSIGYAHGAAYRQSSQVELVAVADVNADNLAAYAQEFRVPPGHIYTDYVEMLKQERPDLVSVCTWPPLHREMVIAAARAGARGIWCEKPMTLSLADADEMLSACRESGTYLIINHQRRFLEPFVAARQVIDSGQIGEVLTIHAGIDDWDLLSWGTHWVDMFRFLLHDAACTWVMSQIDATSNRIRYGHAVEDHGVTCFAFTTGTHAFLETGIQVPNAPVMRIAGSQGLIDLMNVPPDQFDGTLRILSTHHLGWQTPPLSEGLHGIHGFHRSLAELIAAVHGQTESMINGDSGRATTEMILAAYESARLRKRIDLPLASREFPLATYAGGGVEPAASPTGEYEHGH